MAEDNSQRKMDKYEFIDSVCSDIKELIGYIPSSIYDPITTNIKDRVISGLREFPDKIVDGFCNGLLDNSEIIYNFEDVEFEKIYTMFKENKQIFSQDLSIEEYTAVKFFLKGLKKPIFEDKEKKEKFGTKLREILDKFIAQSEE